MKTWRTIGLLLTALLTACTEPWSIDLDDAREQLVITGALCTEPGQYEISVTRSVNYFSEPQELGISGARVTVNDRLLEENPEHKGRYLTPEGFEVKSGESYRLRVELDFDGDGVDEVYTAEALAPQKVELGALTLNPVLKDQDKLFPQAALVFFFDPVGPNYYSARLRYVVGDSLSQWRTVNYSNSPDRCVFNMFDATVEDGSLIAYPCFMVGRRNVIAPNDTLTLFPTDTVEVELNNFSPEYYDFVQQLNSAASGQNPLFMTPVGRYTGNIEGGALGAFGIYTASVKRLPIYYRNRTWTNKELRERFGQKASQMYPDNEDPE